MIAIAPPLQMLKDSPKLINLLNKQYSTPAPPSDNRDCGSGPHYPGLTEDVARARRARELAVDAGTAFISPMRARPRLRINLAFVMTMGFQGA